MAATTITRESMTDNVTAWTVARIGSSIYDRIDSLVGANIIFGGTLSAEGFGVHAFSAGGTGVNSLRVRNTTSGTGNYSSLDAGNNSTALLSRLLALSSAYTTSGYLVASGSVLEANGAGGLSIATTDAAGTVRVYTGASVTLRLQIEANGRIGHGAAANTNVWHEIAGSFAPASGTPIGLNVALGLTAPVDASCYGFRVAPTLVEAASGTHPLFAGAVFEAPTVTVGAGAVTLASTVYIAAAPSASGATNYALYVAAGQSVFPDGSAGAPTFSFLNDPDTGMYRLTTNEIGFTSAGVNIGRYALVGFPFFGLPSGAYGSGVGACQLSIGRNTTGAGAAGALAMTMLSGAGRWLWVDATGDLQIHTAAPTESGGDTSGTVVGDQTSTRASKRGIRPFRDRRGALDLIARTPLYRFQYRATGDRDTPHVGILAEESPAFTRRRGQSFDPVNAFGYTAAAIQALLARVESLEAAAIGRR